MKWKTVLLAVKPCCGGADYTDAYFLYVLYCIAFKKSTEGNQVIKLFSSRTHEQEVMEGNEQEIGWKDKNMFPASWGDLCHILADAFFCLSSSSSCWTWYGARWLGSNPTLPVLCMLLCLLLAFLFPKRCPILVNAWRIPLFPTLPISGA